MVPIREIYSEAGVAVDYEKFQSEDLDGSSFTCRCGSPNCRSDASVENWQQLKATDSNLLFAQPYIQALVEPNISENVSRFADLTFARDWRPRRDESAFKHGLVSTAVEEGAGGLHASRAIPPNKVMGILYPSYHRRYSVSRPDFNELLRKSSFHRIRVGSATSCAVVTEIGCTTSTK